MGKNSKIAFDQSGKAIKVIGTDHDVPKRKQVEARIQHLNLVLRAVRGVNQLIARKKHRKYLIQSSCDLLVESRSYNKMWALLFDQNRNIVSLAASGFGEDV